MSDLQDHVKRTLRSASLGIDCASLEPAELGNGRALNTFFRCNGEAGPLFIKLAWDDGRSKLIASEAELHGKLLSVGFDQLVICLQSLPIAFEGKTGWINVYPFVAQSTHVAPDFGEIGRLVARLHDAGAQLVDAAPELDQVLLHGDLRDANVMCDAGRWHLIDFEFARIGGRAWDLACLPLFLRDSRMLVAPLAAQDFIALMQGYTREKDRLPRLSHHPDVPLSRILETSVPLHKRIAKDVARLAPEAAQMLVRNLDGWIATLGALTHLEDLRHA